MEARLPGLGGRDIDHADSVQFGSSMDAGIFFAQDLELAERHRVAVHLEAQPAIAEGGRLMLVVRLNSDLFGAGVKLSLAHLDGAAGITHRAGETREGLAGDRAIGSGDGSLYARIAERSRDFAGRVEGPPQGNVVYIGDGQQIGGRSVAYGGRERNRTPVLDRPIAHGQRARALRAQSPALHAAVA